MMRSSTGSIFDEGAVRWCLGHRIPSFDSGNQPASESKSGTVSGLRVFIVEDERLIAENLKFIMEEKDCQVIGIASSGEDAVEEAQTQKPDLILMDVRIRGDLDGIQAAILIQQTVKTPRILFLSAHPKEQFPHLKTLSPDTFAYLKKPYTPDDLVDAVKKLFSRSHS